MFSWVELQVDNAVELFAHIDVDFSGSISVEELNEHPLLTIPSIPSPLILTLFFSILFPFDFVPFVRPPDSVKTW